MTRTGDLEELDGKAAEWLEHVSAEQHEGRSSAAPIAEETVRWAAIWQPTQTKWAIRHRRSLS